MTAMLQVRNMTKCFGGLMAVNDVSFDVAEGEIVGLIGPNGAGKTTVFNLISGIIPMDGGCVSLGGRDITEAHIEGAFEELKDIASSGRSSDDIGLLGVRE